MKAKFISGLKWTSTSMVLVNIMQIVQIAILARFLTPSDFGLMAIIMIIVSFSQAFLDMGISSAIIHKQEISHNQLSTLYWINIFMGIFIFIIFYYLNHTIVLFYNEPRLEDLLYLVSFIFLIKPFGQQYMVLLEKDLRFQDIAKIDIFTKFISFIVSIVLAYNDYGVYALVYATLSSILFQTFYFVIIGLKIHIPKFVLNIKEVMFFLKFGMYQMGERAINFVNGEIDVIIIGKVLGIEALGIYSIAKQLIMKPAQIFNPIVTRVSFPMMSIIQDDIEKLKNTYLKMINYLSTFNFYAYMLLILLAPQIVSILYGDKWLEAIPIIQVLSLYGAIRSTSNPVGALLMAKGKAKLGFYWNLGLFFYIPVGIYFFSQYGLMGLSWGIVFLHTSAVIPEWYFLIYPLCKAKFTEFHWQIVKPFMISLSIGLVGYGILEYIINKEELFLPLAIVSISTFLLWILLNKYLNKEFYIQMKEIVLKK
jgi:O-antigen/teichoic acid export membrane protein